jgi:hypothetical protein
MKISDDRGKISDPAGKRDISEISDSTGRYFFSWVLPPTWERHQEERGEVQWIFGYPALSIQTNPMRLNLM